MCTVVLLVRPGHAWPLLLAANRDERLDRPWDRPGAHWPDRPGLMAGRDRLGGGTWMAVRGGVFAAVLNRPGSLGPETGKRSRGGLPLLALEHGSAGAAAAALASLDAGEYRTFNMAVAGRDGAWFIRGLGRGRAEAAALVPGLHIITAHDPNSPDSPRAMAQLPRFRSAPPPDPDTGDWTAWQGLLADRSGEALNVTPHGGFGTVCASLAGVPARGAPVWLFAAGPPDVAAFEPVALP